MKTINYTFIFILFLCFYSANQILADGRSLGGKMQWEKTEGTLEFRSLNEGKLQSLDGEYAITLFQESFPAKIWLEAKKGFDSNLQKRILYAEVNLPFSVSFFTHIRASIDSSNQLLISAEHPYNKTIQPSYPHGIFSLIHVDAQPYFAGLINDSDVAFENALTDGSALEGQPGLGNGTALKSKSGKYTLIFEDRGWVEFVFPLDNPMREIVMWVEIETKPGMKQRLYYASIEYPYTQGAVDDRGVYHVDLPIQINVDKLGHLTLFSSAEVTYPIGLIRLQN